MRPVLVLVDLQRDFLDAAGLEPPASAVVGRAARLLAAARNAGVPVVHAVTSVDPARDDRMPHWKRSGLRRCVRGTAGHEPPEALAPARGEPVVSKTFFSAFSSPGLAPALEASGADTIVLAGVHLHGCVRATALDAYQGGWEVLVADDAVASDDPLHAAVTRRYLEGRAARFLPVEEIARLLAGPRQLRPEPGETLPAAVAGARRLSGEGRPRHVHRSPQRTSETLFAVPCAGADQVAAAAEAAVGAARDPGARAQRSQALFAFADLLENESAALAVLVAGDLGKPVTLARLEVGRTAALVRRAATLEPGSHTRCGSESAMRRVPLGVVAAITPWNNPLAIPWGKIAAALALGDAVVWKPAPAAARVALRSLELARAAGLPEGAVAIVNGDHRTAAALMSDPRVAAVTLSGSSSAGWAAQEACARRRVALQAELGGNNAAIVWDGADLAEAADRIARGAFEFAGQRCTANRRAIVRDALFDGFVERLVGAAAALRWGDPVDPTTEVGPLLSVETRDAVRAALEEAAPLAGRVVVPHGGSAAARELEACGAYLPPAIVVAPPPQAAIVQEETFGPVVVVQRAASFDEALSLANGVRQGLVAALFAGEGAWCERFREEAQAGILKLGLSTADADAAAPFGGWKGSGLGPPERGSGDLEFYTRAQALYGGL